MHFAHSKIPMKWWKGASN